MVEPVTAFAFLNTAFKFSEYAVKLSNVGSENGVFVRLILRVRKDLEEVERLICTPSVKKRLINTPGKLPYIKDVLFSAKSALNDIGRWVERVRADKEGYGSISFENRVRWVFNDHDKLTNRTLELSTNHQSLSNVLQYLMPLERPDSPTIPENAPPPTYDDTTALDEILLSPRQRREIRDKEARERKEKAVSGQQVNTPQASHPQRHLSPFLPEKSPEEVKSVGNSHAPQDSKLREVRSSMYSTLSSQNSGDGPQLTTRASFYGSESYEWPTHKGAPPTPPKTMELQNIQRRTLSQSTDPSTSSSNTTLPFIMPSASLRTPAHSVVQILQVDPYGMPSLALNSSQPAPNQQGHGTSGKNYGYSQKSSPDRLPWCRPPIPHNSDHTKERRSTTGDISHTQSTEPTQEPSQHTCGAQKTITPQFSGTNEIGPVNPFDMYTEMEAPSPASPFTNLDKDPMIQTRALMDQSQVFSQPSPPIPPKTHRFGKQSENIAELTGDLPLRQREEIESFHQHSRSRASTCCSSISELLVDNSSGERKLSTAYEKISAGATSMPENRYSATINASADRYCAVERSQNPLPQFHTPPPTDEAKLQPQYSSFPIPLLSQDQEPIQNQFQYPPFPTQGTQSQLYSQLEVQMEHHAQSQYLNHYQFNTQTPQNQSQVRYQTQPQSQFYSQTQSTIFPPQSQARPLYLHPRSQSVSTIPPSPITTYTQSPVPWSGQQQINTDTRPVSPQTQPATPTQITASSSFQDHGLSRSGTMAEQRRRDRRAMLNLMEG
ncbi:hypothetical protein BGZ60DRAFT_525376 [Tricladium varicosporioides]|nr:hypothetical protein BGZ60DRAFT_525376 [Hymenoscyphus varicosporioides]